MQEKYAGILYESKEACRDGTSTSPLGFGASGAEGRPTALQPIVEQEGKGTMRGGRQGGPPGADFKKMDRKLKNREAIKKRKEMAIKKSPGKVAAEEKEKRKEEEILRREEIEKRIEVRANASKKKEEMDYRNKIRQQAEDNAAAAKQKANYETVDEKLILMFKSHCARVTKKLSQVDKMSADFKALKEFDGYSSSDRLKLRPVEDAMPRATPTPATATATGLAALHVHQTSGSTEGGGGNLPPDDHTSGGNTAFLSKPLMM